jgi:hypothetical protein
MVDKVFILLGIVIFLISTKLYFDNVSSTDNSFRERLFDSINIFKQETNRQSIIGIAITFYQNWGLLWFILGIAINFINNSFLSYLCVIFIFFGPIGLSFLYKKRIRKKREKNGL